MNEAFIDYVRGKSNAGLINNPSFEISIAGILENDQVTDEADVTTGWHAIEFLLWGQDFNAQGPGQRSHTDFLPNQGNNNRRREYLELVTAQLIEDLMFLESEWKPDANNYYRFATTFLTFLTDIGPQDIQTSHGVITLNEEYTGHKLSHNDSIMVLARCI